MAFKVISKEKYTLLNKKYEAHNKAFEKYRKLTGSNAIDNKVAKAFNIPKGTTNKQTSQIEIYKYKNKPLKVGEKYTAYISDDGKKVTTWTGATIGAVSSIRGTKRREYFSFDAVDINGHKLKGMAYAGLGGYVRLRRVA